MSLFKNVSSRCSVLLRTSLLKSCFCTATTQTEKKPQTPTSTSVTLRINSFENSHALYLKSKDQQDRILVLGDLLDHVSKTRYDINTFKERNTNFDAVKKNVEKLYRTKFSLFGVFDGHLGKIAAEYVTLRLPYELVASEDFAAGFYEKALKTAYLAVHKALLQSPKYAPEGPQYDFTSGTTASVALVTPKYTYFASLGDSPIVVLKSDPDGFEKPQALFTGYREEDVQRLQDSDIFLVSNYNPHSVGTDREKAFQAMTVKREYRHGFSDIKVLGSIGDSIYEPEPFNAFVSSLNSFNKEKAGTFSQLSKHFKQQRNWPILQKHMTIADKRVDQSWLVAQMFEGVFGSPMPLKKSPLGREPQTLTLANSDLDWFIVASDGLLQKKYELDEGAMQSFQVLIEQHFEKEGKLLCKVLEKWNYGEFDDDVSCVMVNFKTKENKD